jgi:glycosyltransferase involved in cell wall biosynthesis
MQRLISENSLENLIRIYSWRAFRNIVDHNDILLIFSRYEGVPVVLTEAMAAGFPVVSTKLAGTRDLDHSCLFNLQSTHLLIKILDSFKDGFFYQRIQNDNIKLFKKRFSYKTFHEAADKVLQKLV